MARPPYTTGFRKGRVPKKHQRVFRVLLTGAPDLSGFPLGQRAGVGSGTVYPLLAALEKLGWVSSEWESPDTPMYSRPGPLPRRRFYKLTATGRENVARLLGMQLEER